MKKKNWESLLESNIEKILERLNNEYEIAIEKGRNKYASYCAFHEKSRREFNKVQHDNKTYSGQMLRLINEIKSLLETDKYVNYNDAFELHTESYSVKDREIIIGKIADIEAYASFMTFLYDEEEKYLPKQKVDTDEKVIEENVVNKEFTTSRQVLAIHFLFKAFGTKNFDKTEQARFIQFLTSKEAGNKKIQNTTIYKKVCSPYRRNDKSFENDLKFIKPYFEKLGMMEVVDMINKEL